MGRQNDSSYFAIPLSMPATPAGTMAIRRGHAGTLASGQRESALRRRRGPARLTRECGRSSEVERQLPKLNVVGSIPIARSSIFNGLVTLTSSGTQGPPVAGTRRGHTI